MRWRFAWFVKKFRGVKGKGVERKKKDRRWGLGDFGHFGATTGDDRVSKFVPRRMWLRMSSRDGAEA